MFRKLQRAKGPQASAHEAWTAVRTEYESVARTPKDHDAWARLAGRLTATCMLPPTEARIGKKLPAGFTQRPDGELQDCLLTARALELHGSLFTAGVHPGLLLPMRARLRFGWRQYDQALADLELAARHIPANHPNPARERSEFAQQSDECRAAAEAETAPSAPTEVKLRGGITIAARGAARLLDLTPYRNAYYPRGSGIEVQLEPGLRAIDRELTDAGLPHLTWTDHIGIAERLGKRILSGFWVGPQGGYGVSAGVTAKGTRSISVMSQLADGRILETANTRGRTYYARGPWVDLLQIDATEPLADLLQLHVARLSMVTATTGTFWTPLDSVDALVRMRELERGYAAEHRLEHGLDEAEARGHPFKYPQFTVPLLQRAAWEAVQAAALGRAAA